MIRIILIEDHNLTRMGLKAGLSQVEDMDVVGEAATGREGLERLKTQPADIAIVAIGLPDMDGIEVVEALRQFQASQGLDRLPAQQTVGARRPRPLIPGANKSDLV
jgi:DNA-binding NarL/FixJ family response regulator